ncbi:MAG: hypothetical protein HDQ87_02275 [Clostridia bacterium]|nr:hypothetical protein [Clostridia bacterium]
MVRVNAFVICDGVLEGSMRNGDPIHLLASPQVSIRLPRIPATYSCSIYVGIVGFDIDGVGRMAVVLLDPAGQPVKRTAPMEISRKTLPPYLEEDLPADQHALATICELHKARIKSEGLYTFVLVYNSQDIASLPIPIYRQKKGR